MKKGLPSNLTAVENKAPKYLKEEQQRKIRNIQNILKDKDNHN